MRDDKIKAFIAGRESGARWEDFQSIIDIVPDGYDLEAFFADYLLLDGLNYAHGEYKDGGPITDALERMRAGYYKLWFEKELS